MCDHIHVPNCGTKERERERKGEKAFRFHNAVFKKVTEAWIYPSNLTNVCFVEEDWGL